MYGFRDHGSHDLVTSKTKALHYVVAPVGGEQGGREPWETNSPSLLSLKIMRVSLDVWERP